MKGGFFSFIVMGMTKSELIARLAARNPHLYQRDVERIVATVFDEISKALAGGHRVELRGFGAFSVKNELKTDAEVKELLEKIS